MRIVVVGSTPLSGQLACALAASGDSVTVVRPDGGDLELASADVRVVTGDPLLVLEAAGSRRADVVVACTGSDADNLVVSLLAKRHFKVPRVLAQVNEADHAWLFEESWGVDEAVSVASLLVAAVKRAVVATSSSDPAGGGAPPGSGQQASAGAGE